MRVAITLAVTLIASTSAFSQSRDALWSACQNGTPAEVIDACTRLAETAGEAPENRAIALFNRANIQRGTGKFDPALNDYSDALSLRPDFQQALANRATIWLQKSDLPKALADLDAALKLNPRDAIALRTRAIVRIRQEEPARALPDLAAAIEANPRYASAYQTRCAMLATGVAGQPDGAAALADCDTALKLAPQSVDVLRSRGLALLRLARAVEAATSFAQAVRLNPRDAVALYGHAVALQQSGGDPGRAADAARVASEIEPSVAQRYQSWGLAAVQR